MRFRSRVKDLLTAALVAAALYAAVRYMPDGPPQKIAGPAYVIDGDSLDILGATVRLAGLDAPETRQTCGGNGKTWDCGEAAATALRRRIAGRAVSCETITYDRYHRVLAECFLTGLNLNEWLVREGWAVSSGGYQRAEAEARGAKRGLWTGTFERPADWRREQGRRSTMF